LIGRRAAEIALQIALGAFALWFLLWPNRGEILLLAVLLFVIYLVERWQDLQRRVSELQRQVHLLEEKNTSLERELWDAHISAPSPPYTPTVFEGFDKDQ
jgi:hypothetical protein